MQYVDNMPVAKTLYAERLSDKKEFFIHSAFVNKESGIGGVNGISKDGEKTELKDGSFRLYRR